MSCSQVLLCIIFPPLAVLDKGCGSIALVTLLSLAGWIPGVLVALLIINGGNNKQITIIQQADRVIGNIDKDNKIENTVSKMDRKQRMILVAVVAGTLLFCCYCCLGMAILGSLAPKSNTIPASYSLSK